MKWQAIIAAAVISVTSAAGAADKKYGPGVTDTEIKLGQTSPYSGPASAYSVIAKAQLAYFKMINDQGGINGRKINLISIDDAYSPAKTVEQTRKLVEQEEVAAILNPLGTPTGLAVRKYLNDKKVPQLFVGAGATLWGDHEHFPVLDRVPGLVSGRDRGLCQICPDQEAGCEDRAVLSERRRRQGLRQRIQEGAGPRQRQEDGGGGSDL